MDLKKTNTENSRSKKSAVNPYLPEWEYVPDGEPHIFGNRIYVYGSHDRAHGTAFCQEDYVVWSAPVDDLTDWYCHGVIYRKDQDPHNIKQMKELWAPDVCRGADGRYYLYYCRSFSPEIGIAVCDEPAGKYEFYDFVRDERGEIWNHDLPFDPGVLYEDPGHIWLYTGFGCEPLRLPEGFSSDMLRQQNTFKDFDDAGLERIVEQIQVMMYPSEGASCLRLAPDMKTVITVSSVAPAKKNAAGTSFEEHPFFEASSIRKIGDTYYFVYSSFQGHELCYATSDYPDRDFVFRGVIVSNADLGYHGNRKPRAYYANNHGGLAEINGRWYVFYHRHTNKSPFSRQGCAEPVELLADGTIPQIEMTSCGLNGGPLPGRKRYSAHICCNLMGPEGAVAIDSEKEMEENAPYITEEILPDGTKNAYICNLQAGAVCGVKYLEFSGEEQLTLVMRGSGKIEIVLDVENGTEIGTVCTEQVNQCGNGISATVWKEYTVHLPKFTGVHAVYFRAVGDSCRVDLSGFEFNNPC